MEIYMNEIPVYLFTGFMDSGKTTLVKETLFDDGFTEGGRSVVICCETEMSNMTRRS